jgi:hypothetical protein
MMQMEQIYTDFIRWRSFGSLRSLCLIGTLMTRIEQIYTDFIRWRSFWFAGAHEVFFTRVKGVKELKGVFLLAALA